MTAFITGAAGSGKTAELLRRAHAAAQNANVLLTSPSAASLALLRSQCGIPGARLCSPAELALQVTGDSEFADDVRAAELFAAQAEPLLSLSWTELIEAEVDPEVPGLRAPERFLDAAFRLFCKLRDALISPEQFQESALRGAAQFYAKPPNLASAELLHYTKDSHRDSLDADARELQRQYRREIDLAKILAKLYRTYLDRAAGDRCLTPRDIVAEAAAALKADPARAQALRESLGPAFVDDAQEMTLGQLHFLQCIYGEHLENVTLAGDAASATSSFRGARPDRVFALPGERTELDAQFRVPPAVEAAARHLAGAAHPLALPPDTPRAITLFRASTQRAEAQFIADRVVDLLSEGASHEDIAIVFRTVAAVRPYRDALLERNVRVQVAGDLSVFSEPEALDALALLWTLYDPFRHEYLLRVLSGHAMALSDASIYTLCGDPPDAQTLLFSEDGQASAPARSGRWDPKRDLRLGWNVLHGDRDGDLSPQARERVQRFREKRAGWADAMRRLTLAQLVRLVWSEGLARVGEPGSAHDAYQQQTLSRLYARIDPRASLGDFLDYAQARMESGFEASETSECPGSVRILSLDAARGREFDHVILPNAKAGAFPRWYVPDSFLYSPSMGMIAKENVGDAHAARTAKFSYYMYRTQARERYNEEERRAFVYAMRRSRKTLTVTASERATRGVAAPEFLKELQMARLHGVEDLSDRWRPTRAVYAGR